MEINYWWLGLIVLLLAALVYWLIKRNLKDEKVFEKDLTGPKHQPER